jgi:hypothetical protein
MGKLFSSIERSIANVGFSSVGREKFPRLYRAEGAPKQINQAQAIHLSKQPISSA